MAAKFNPGQIVRLKSGGPDMTIERISELGEGRIYFCSWFAGAKDNHKGFREESLELSNNDE